MLCVKTAHCPSSRSRRTRQDIHRAALGLARTRQVQEITVEQIAEAAGVSRRTFFNHFPTKNDVFIPDLDEVPPRALADFASRRTPGLLDAVEELMVARMEVLEQTVDDDGTGMEVVHGNPELHPLLMARVHDFETAVREAAAQRLGVPGTSPDAVATACLVTSVERTVLGTWHAGPRRTPLSELVPPAVDGLRNALAG